MHASIKASRTSVTIWIWIQIRILIRDLVRHQNLIICHWPENFMQIRSKFLRKVANKRTDKQRRKHILLGGRNNNNQDNTYGAVIMASHWLSSAGSFDERRLECHIAVKPLAKYHANQFGL